MDIAISSGHGTRIRGAKGFLDEVDENRRVTDRVAVLLRSVGHTVHVYHDTTSKSVAANLSAIVNWHNSRKRDRDVSVHFNAFQTTNAPRGTEVLWTSPAGSAIATSVNAAMARAGGFINRGAKKRTDLSFLNRTAKPAVLLEVCFVDSRTDTDLYKRNFESICRAIAESVGGKAIPRPTDAPVEEPPPRPEPVDPGVTDDNVVDIEIKVRGDITVAINRDTIIEGKSANRLSMYLGHVGDVLVNINGEDFQVEANNHGLQQGD